VCLSRFASVFGGNARDDGVTKGKLNGGITRNKN
jgi:hypothetical protein